MKVIFIFCLVYAQAKFPMYGPVSKFDMLGNYSSFLMEVKFDILENENKTIKIFSDLIQTLESINNNFDLSEFITIFSKILILTLDDVKSLFSKVKRFDEIDEIKGTPYEFPSIFGLLEPALEDLLDATNSLVSSSPAQIRQKRDTIDFLPFPSIKEQTIYDDSNLVACNIKSGRNPGRRLTCIILALRQIDTPVDSFVGSDLLFPVLKLMNARGSPIWQKSPELIEIFGLESADPTNLKPVLTRYIINRIRKGPSQEQRNIYADLSFDQDSEPVRVFLSSEIGSVDDDSDLDIYSPGVSLPSIKSPVPISTRVTEFTHPPYLHTSSTEGPSAVLRNILSDQPSKTTVTQKPTVLQTTIIPTTVLSPQSPPKTTKNVQNPSTTTFKQPENHQQLLELIVDTVDRNKLTADTLVENRKSDLKNLESLEIKLSKNSKEDNTLKLKVNTLGQFQENILENKINLITSYLLTTRTLVLEFASFLDNPAESLLPPNKFNKNVTFGTFYRTKKGIGFQYFEYKLEDLFLYEKIEFCGNVFCMSSLENRFLSTDLSFKPVFEEEECAQSKGPTLSCLAPKKPKKCYWHASSCIFIKLNFQPSTIKVFIDMAVITPPNKEGLDLPFNVTLEYGFIYLVFFQKDTTLRIKEQEFHVLSTSSKNTTWKDILVMKSPFTRADIDAMFSPSHFQSVGFLHSVANTGILIVFLLSLLVLSVIKACRLRATSKQAKKAKYFKIGNLRVTKSCPNDPPFELK